MDPYLKLWTVYGEDCTSHPQVYKWYERFKNDCGSVESDSRCGRPSTSKSENKIEIVNTAVQENSQITISE